jgi:hypothetical protein
MDLAEPQRLLHRLACRAASPAFATFQIGKNSPPSTEFAEVPSHQDHGTLWDAARHASRQGTLSVWPNRIL